MNTKWKESLRQGQGQGLTSLGFTRRSFNCSNLFGISGTVAAPRRTRRATPPSDLCPFALPHFSREPAWGKYNRPWTHWSWVISMICLCVSNVSCVCSRRRRCVTDIGFAPRPPPGFYPWTPLGDFRYQPPFRRKNFCYLPPLTLVDWSLYTIPVGRTDWRREVPYQYRASYCRAIKIGVKNRKSQN